MSNKQQTALEWLYQDLFPNKLDGFSWREWAIIEKAFKQAKELEKQQIKEAFYLGFKKGYNVGHADAESHTFALTIAEYIHKDFEQYYKETYGE